MTVRTFHFQLHSGHLPPQRATANLRVELRNAQEKRIPLEQVKADFVVTTGSDRIVDAVEGDVHLRLDPAASIEEHQLADAEAIATVQERMKLCPVSRNLPEHVQKRIALSAEPC